jgi:hypothetical protein
VDRRHSNNDALLAALEDMPLADPQVHQVLNELLAEVSQLRSRLADAERHSAASSPTLNDVSTEALAQLLIEQGAELARTQEQVHRIRALCEFSEWAFANGDSGEASVLISDLKRALSPSHNPAN